MNNQQQINNIDIVRAWKDEAYRESLSVEQRQALPENPAGEIEISESEAAKIWGGCALQTTFDVIVDSIGTTCHCPTRINRRG